VAIKDGDFVLINYVISVKSGDKEVVGDTNKEDVAKSAGIYDANRKYEPYLVVLGRSPGHKGNRRTAEGDGRRPEEGVRGKP